MDWHEIVEDAERNRLTIVNLRCAGGYHSTVVGGRYLKAPCRRGHCPKTDLGRRSHVWDLVTGKQLDDVYEVDAGRSGD